MKPYFLDINLNDKAGLAGLRGHLKRAAIKMNSREPDSLGEDLFNAMLSWILLDRSGGADADFIKEVCDLLNQFEEIAFGTKYRATPTMIQPIYRYVAA